MKRMNNYNPKYHHRRSIRLKGYDYTQEGLYFITLCIQDREHIFGEIKNGEMHLNAFGKIAEMEWHNTPIIRDNVALHEHIIMPNHMHGIIEITFQKSNTPEIGAFKSPSQSIGSIIRGYKIATIKRIKDLIKNSNLEDNKGEFKEGDKKENYKGEFKKKENYSTGELQFAPTKIPKGFAPTARFAPTKIPKGFAPTARFAPTKIPEGFAPTARFAPTAEAKKIINLDFKIWQRNYYEHIIRDKKSYKNISNYIINNPKKWEEDQFNKKYKKKASFKNK